MNSQSVERTIYDFLINDFVTAWDAVAHEPHARGRGNFMFGRHVMALLEWAARLCSADPSDDALTAFSASLVQAEPRYFTLLPGPCADTRDFELPGRSGLTAADQRSQLLWAIFDLVRHGLGHQHLPIGVDLQGGGVFGIGLTGAEHGLDLAASQAGGDGIHLGIRREGAVLALTVRTEVMFRHIRHAIEQARLLERGLRFPYLLRPSPPSQRLRPGYSGPRYAFSLDQLESTLLRAGHPPYRLATE